uniref:Suppressor APC domain containing 1 n=1 Tax=Amphiprion percula TaxID=161767 RepID=A0A3P8T9P6_AMPPE
MACPSSGSASYTVVIIPLKTSLYSLDALRFYLWIKRLKDLEKEKDTLCSGLEVLEKARLWYLQRLEENKSRQSRIEAKSGLGNNFHTGIEKCLRGIRAGIRLESAHALQKRKHPLWRSTSEPSSPGYQHLVNYWV